MTELQELREIVQKQARRVTVLTRLVERMGKHVDDHCSLDCHEPTTLFRSYTPAGQREYDAAMKRLNEAGGPPPDAVSEGAWGHE